MKPQRVALQVADQALRNAVRAGTLHKDAGRKGGMAQLRDPDALRELAGRIKQHTLDNLDRYLARFVDRLEALGGQVHFAETGEQARETIVRIARQRGLRFCAKAKSMTSEEIGLAEALQAAGLDVVETDLGELIVQIDGDRPSHIVAPIIHKTRAEVARSLCTFLDVPYTEEPPELTRHARAHLRDVFRRCDLGITGVNFAVAETGTLCVCTNEGNARFAVTRPKVHVALMGIEKVIPRMADLAVFLKLLSRSSGPQPLTVYTTLINGPRRPDEPDGPEHLHVVLLDGGRSDILAGEFRPTLRCIRCGACLNVCPVYRTVGGHAYGSVYAGPIGKLVSPLLGGLGRYRELPQASSLCGACLEACPVRIDIPDLLVRMRARHQRQGLIGRRKRLLLRLVFAMLSRSWTYRLGQRVLRLLLTGGADDRWASLSSELGGAFADSRDLPRPAPRTFRQLWREELANE